MTGASIGLTRDINTVSRVGLDFAYATQVNQDNPDEPNIDRTDLTLSYGYDFTEAVSAEVGYSFRNRVEDPQNATSNRCLLRDRPRLRDRPLTRDPVDGPDRAGLRQSDLS